MTKFEAGKEYQTRAGEPAKWKHTSTVGEWGIFSADLASMGDKGWELVTVVRSDCRGLVAYRAFWKMKVSDSEK